jgi:hypothetical protein
MISDFQLHNQLKQIPVTHHHVVPMLNATMESVLAFLNTRETLMLGVDLNVSSVLTAPGTELVLEINVLIHVQALVVREPHVM